MTRNRKRCRDQRHELRETDMWRHRDKTTPKKKRNTRCVCRSCIDSSSQQIFTEHLQSQALYILGNQREQVTEFHGKRQSLHQALAGMGGERWDAVHRSTDIYTYSLQTTLNTCNIPQVKSSCPVHHFSPEAFKILLANTFKYVVLLQAWAQMGMVSFILFRKFP